MVSRVQKRDEAMERIEQRIQELTSFAPGWEPVRARLEEGEPWSDVFPTGFSAWWTEALTRGEAWVTRGLHAALRLGLVVRSDMRVVQVGLTVFTGAAGVRMNLLMCASGIVLLPTLALYFAAQRYFLEDSLRAGIKG